MSRITNISGFPEWLPEQKLVEDEFIQSLKKLYSSHGFVPIETPAVELLPTLLSKGAVEKEIFGVHRLHSEESSSEAELGLHFNLTVPLARYVAQHQSRLVFPFKRYQVQKVWRGERPQKGRFREFYQFDADVIVRGDLPLACDAEVLGLMEKSFGLLSIVNYKVVINNRKILYGAYRELGLDSTLAAKAISAVDKLGKIGADGLRRELLALELGAEPIERILELSHVRVPVADAETKLRSLGFSDEQFGDGVNDLVGIFSLLPEQTADSIEVSLGLARGLDYYTGLIFEVVLPDNPEYGSVGSGGRYENLTESFTSEKLPGVGMSFGLTRLLDFVFRAELVKTERRSSVDVLVAVYGEDQRVVCNRAAAQLRESGLSVEVYYRSPKLGKQIEYAEQKAIPHVLFIDPQTGKHGLKNIQTREQREVSLDEIPGLLRGPSI